jgi:hypothetical protein
MSYEIKWFEEEKKKLDKMAAKDKFVSATFASVMIDLAIDEMKKMAARISELESEFDHGKPDGQYTQKELNEVAKNHFQKYNP